MSTHLCTMQTGSDFLGHLWIAFRFSLFLLILNTNCVLNFNVCIFACQTFACIFFLLIFFSFHVQILSGNANGHSWTGKKIKVKNNACRNNTANVFFFFPVKTQNYNAQWQRNTWQWHVQMCCIFIIRQNEWHNSVCIIETCPILLPYINRFQLNRIRIKFSR